MSTWGHDFRKDYKTLGASKVSHHALMQLMQDSPRPACFKDGAARS